MFFPYLITFVAGFLLAWRIQSNRYTSIIRKTIHNFQPRANAKFRRSDDTQPDTSGISS